VVLGAPLAGRSRVNCQGVHAPVEFAGKRLVDQAVTFEPGLPFEGLCHNIDAEMRLSARPMAGVPTVLVGLIDNA
jgi:hypothetical protein